MVSWGEGHGLVGRLYSVVERGCGDAGRRYSVKMVWYGGMGVWCCGGVWCGGAGYGVTGVWCGGTEVWCDGAGVW